MQLHNYWRSTTSYRVRIALNLKGLAYDYVPVNLLGGDQKSPAYAAMNPLMAVPTLVLEDGTALIQSSAILEWLEETYPEPALLPQSPQARARVRGAVGIIASDIHPVINLKVVGRLREMGHTQEEGTAWINRWMAEGLAAFAAMIESDTPFCFGDTPGLADIYLVAQLYSVHRWRMDMTGLERLAAIEARCLALPEFDSARPENQPDAE